MTGRNCKFLVLKSGIYVDSAFSPSSAADHLACVAGRLTFTDIQIWRLPDLMMGCPQFGECEFSVYTGSLPSLEESSEQLKDTVTFLLGGSFSLGEV